MEPLIGLDCLPGRFFVMPQIGCMSRNDDENGEIALSESTEERTEGIFKAAGIEPPLTPAQLPAMPLETTALADIEPREVHWLWRGRIPLGKLTTLDGDPGVGKSTVLADLAARVSTGQEMPDGSPGVEGSVVILNAEDDPADTARPRLEAAGADLGRVHYVMIDENLPSIVDAADELTATLMESRARLLIVDPLATFMGSATKTDKTNSTSQAMFQIKRAVADADCAGVLVRHLNKDVKQGKALYRGTNSISIIGTVRSGLVAGIDPDDPERYVLGVSKANLAARGETRSIGYRIVTAASSVGPTSKVEWLGEVEYDADSIVSGGEGRKSSPRQNAVTWLHEFLGSGPCPANEVISAAGKAAISERTLTRAKKEIGVGSAKQTDGKWVWSLPKETR